MSRFLDKLPRIRYDINKNGYSNFETITDISFRFSIIKDVINNASAYYEYTIKDGETPEMLADRVYGDPESYWIILYANDVYDPHYDWPMNNEVFDKYVASKYGSLVNAKSQIHHYEKIIARQTEGQEVVYVDRQTVDYSGYTELTCTLDNITANLANVSISDTVLQRNAAEDFIFVGTVNSIDTANNLIYLNIEQGKVQNYQELLDSSYKNLGRVIDNNQKNIDFYLNLPIEPVYTSYVINNKTVTEAISRNAVSCYDYELEVNEKKRNIKIIKKEYYGQILTEFESMTNSKPSFYRRLV